MYMGPMLYETNKPFLYSVTIPEGGLDVLDRSVSTNWSTIVQEYDDSGQPIYSENIVGYDFRTNNLVLMRGTNVIIERQ